MAYPGLEQLVFNWRKHSQVKDRLARQSHPGLKVYSNQTDGTYIHSLLDPSGRRVDEGPFEGTQEIFLNLSLDWLNIQSLAFGPGHAVGPILFQMANLPQAMRGLQAMVMCIGLTPSKLVHRESNTEHINSRLNRALPGPKESNKDTLWKSLLPLILELCQTWAEPISIKTPNCPNGVQCRIYLAAISCDWPAFTSLTRITGQTS